MMDNDKARRDPNKSHFWGPAGFILEGSPKGRTKWVMKDGDNITTDYRTAHARASDENFEKDIPETCGACRAIQLANQATEKAKT